MIKAAYAGQLPVVEFLLERGAGVNVADGEELTAFLAASLAGHLDVLRLLKGWGAALDTLDKHGSSAVALSCQGGHLAAAQFVYGEEQEGAARKALLCQRGSEGMDACMRACRGGHLKVVEWLLEEIKMHIEEENEKG
jgi:ankyrin repeat protein